MEQYIAEFAAFLRLHIASISVGLVSTVITIYGSSINGAARKLTRKMPFLARFAFFIVLCSAGYALLSSQATRGLRHLLMSLSDGKLIIAIFAAFIILALLAKSSKNA